MPLTPRRLLTAALVVSSLFVGCSSDDSSGGSGQAGSNSGVSGAGGDTGSAGEQDGDAGSDSGTAGSDSGSAGSDSGTAGSDSGTAGSDSGSAGSAGGDAGSAGSDAGSAGSDAGSAGSDAGSAGSAGSAGAGAFPTTCEESHGDVGCCGSEKLLYWFEHGEVVEVECDAGTVCGWDADGEYYDCVKGTKTTEDPSKTFPAACFGAPIQGQGLCGPECETDDDCVDNGYGAVCDTAKGLCGCSKDADCKDNPNGSICDTATKSCGCTKDADCTDPDYSVCGDFGGCDFP